MWHFSCFSLSFCSLLFFLCSSANALSVDLTNGTCKQCADKSTIFNYDFCLTSLQVIPISHVTNLQGLALVAMALALENATNTISSIEEMLSSGQFDPFSLDCLKDCLELYADSVPTLVNSIAVFLEEQYDAAYLLLRTIMEITSACEEGFKEREGHVSPLTKENYNLFQLVDIALCITNMSSVALDSESS